MEIIIIAIVVAAGVAIWYFNRDNGLDVNKDGKVDFEDAKEAVENAVEGVKEVVEEKKAEVKAKKVAKPKAKKTEVDLDSMNKTQLLEEAKKRGVKANASLKKDEILERIKNG